jgi:hypothetical protein
MPDAILARALPYVPEDLTNTRRIAESCYPDWDFKQTIFPSFRQFSWEAAFETLHRKTYEGARWRHGTLSAAVQQRIAKELAVIREKGYANYFLVVGEIVRQAPRTCGRGAAASIVPAASGSRMWTRFDITYCLNASSIQVVTIHRILTSISHGMSDNGFSNGYLPTMGTSRRRWSPIKTPSRRVPPCGRSPRSMRSARR